MLELVRGLSICLSWHLEAQWSKKNAGVIQRAVYMFVLVFQKPSIWSRKNAGVGQRAVYMFVLVFQKPSI